MAYRVNTVEGYAQNEYLFKKGYFVWADLEYWRGKKWESKDNIVKFTFESSGYFWVEKTVFIKNTLRRKVKTIWNQ